MKSDPRFIRQLAAVEFSRRRFLESMALAAGVLVLPKKGFASEAPWALRPDGGPDNLTYVVWQYGNIYRDITDRFKADWNVDVNEVIEANVAPQVAKLAAMLAAGDQVDVTQVPPGHMGAYIDQDIIMPINGLPGADLYQADFTQLYTDLAVRDGKVMGLPYFSGIWSFFYNEEMLEKAGFGGQPFSTYEELIEQCVKAKQDGLTKYPLLWVGGVGTEQLPGTWYTLTHSNGGRMFDDDFTPLMGPGSDAREALKLWRSTFIDLEIADPASLNYRFIPAVKAFNTGQYVYLGAQHHFYITFANDPAQSPIAGKVRFHQVPGRSIGVSLPYVLSTAHGDVDWAWALLQYFGGKTQDGEYTMAHNLARTAMLGSGYESVMNGTKIRGYWSKWSDPAPIIAAWDKATNIDHVVPAINSSWYPKFIDTMNVEVASCLRGEATADQTCDRLMARVAELR